MNCKATKKQLPRLQIHCTEKYFYPCLNILYHQVLRKKLDSGLSLGVPDGVHINGLGGKSHTSFKVDLGIYFHFLAPKHSSNQLHCFGFMLIDLYFMNSSLQESISYQNKWNTLHSLHLSIPYIHIKDDSHELGIMKYRSILVSKT